MASEKVIGNWALFKFVFPLIFHYVTFLSNFFFQHIMVSILVQNTKLRERWAPESYPLCPLRPALFSGISSPMTLWINFPNTREIFYMMKYSYRWIVLMKFLNEINEILAYPRLIISHSYQESRLHYTYLSHSLKLRGTKLSALTSYLLATVEHEPPYFQLLIRN